MIFETARRTEEETSAQRAGIDRIVEVNQKRVMDAFRHQRVSDSHFNPTTGYGYDDFGRETLEQVYAEVFGGEDALVRPQIVSGTHAITTALFGVLRPGDQLLYITGKPYDTLEGVIGNREEDTGSLKDFGVTYDAVDLTADGAIDYPAVAAKLSEKTKVVAIQRSKGYADRPSFSVAEIGEMISFVKEKYPEAIIFVDNCYGEFAETEEPLHVGADMIAGSLIKNPGGGIVRAGGYIAGRADLIELCANRLTAPGLGKETGASLGMLQELFQGFFLAPHVVGEALKGAIFTSRFLELLGFSTSPKFDSKRVDLIQSVNFHSADQMIAFCQAIQHASPVNAHVTPHAA
ncbi:aminotransferase class I/II-fold pyridoxal phosphate-dependent enzyme, partial [Terribacillus saccharophilus]